MSTKVILSISPNEGYSPEQVQTSVTLADLLEAVEHAISEYGEDAVIITDNGQRYGAQFGKISKTWGEVEFTSPEDEDEEEF